MATYILLDPNDIVQQQQMMAAVNNSSSPTQFFTSTPPPTKSSSSNDVSLLNKELSRFSIDFRRPFSFSDFYQCSSFFRKDLYAYTDHMSICSTFRRLSTIEHLFL